MANSTVPVAGEPDLLCMGVVACKRESATAHRDDTCRSCQCQQFAPFPEQKPRVILIVVASRLILHAIVSSGHVR